MDAALSPNPESQKDPVRRRLSLFARQVHQERGGIEFDGRVTPDVELIELGETPVAPLSYDAAGASAASRS
jgi:hypothetical protein